METNSQTIKDASTNDVLKIPIYTNPNYDLSFFPVPGTRLRQWWEEDSKTKNHARFCLPMLAANNYGFYILSPADIQIYWNGSLNSDAQVTVHNPCSHAEVTTHSAHGCITIQTNFIPRTPRNVFTYIKPVPNLRLPIQPLEGMMETWWLVANFGLVCFVNQPGMHYISKGDPIAHMIFVGSSIHDYEIFHAGDVSLLEGRQQFVEKRNNYTTKQLDYMKGIKPDESFEPCHYTKFKNSCPRQNRS